MSVNNTWIALVCCWTLVCAASCLAIIAVLSSILSFAWLAFDGWITWLSDVKWAHFMSYAFGMTWEDFHSGEGLLSVSSSIKDILIIWICWRGSCWFYTLCCCTGSFTPFSSLPAVFPRYRRALFPEIVSAGFMPDMEGNSSWHCVSPPHASPRLLLFSQFLASSQSLYDQYFLKVV